MFLDVPRCSLWSSAISISDGFFLKCPFQSEGGGQIAIWALSLWIQIFLNISVPPFRYDDLRLSQASTHCRDQTNWFALGHTFRHWFNYNCLFPKRPSPSAVLSYPAGQKLVCAPGFADSIQSTLLQTRTYEPPKIETKTFIIYFWHHRCSSSHYSLRSIHSTPTFCSEAHKQFPIAF